MYKGTQPDVNGRAVEICHDYGLQAKAMFIWGLPGDGSETAEAMVAWVAPYRPHSIQVSSFIPLPGSPLWRNGYCHRVTDYCAFSFFDNGSRSAPAGVANDRLSAEELHCLCKQILAECARFTDWENKYILSDLRDPDMTIARIWQGPVLTQLRAEQCRGIFSEICAKCHDYNPDAREHPYEEIVARCFSEGTSRSRFL